MKQLFNLLQEINHAGAGGLWAELVRNRGHLCVLKIIFHAWFYTCKCSMHEFLKFSYFPLLKKNHFDQVLKLEAPTFPQIFIPGQLLEMIQPYSSQLIVALALREIKSHCV